MSALTFIFRDENQDICCFLCHVTMVTHVTPTQRHCDTQVCTKSLNEQPLRQILSPPICLLSSYFPPEMPIEVSKITSNCLQGLLGKMFFGLLLKNLKICLILSLTYNVTAPDQVDTCQRLLTATKVKVTLPKSPSQVT